MRSSPPPALGIGDLPLPAAPEFGVAAGRLARWVEPVAPDTALAQVRLAFAEKDALLAIPVVDAGGAPIGVIHRYKLLERLEHESRQRAAALTVGLVMDRQPLVLDAATPVDALGTLILARPRPHVSDAFLVTRSGRYAGLGTALDLVRVLSERRDQDLRRMAEHDMLTGLPNRHLFDEALSQALARAAGTDRVAVLLVDLDRFREINDTYGHRFGDLVLCGVSQRLRAALRKSDLVARLSGDEFAVVLTDMNTAADAEAVARVLVASCRAPLEVHGREVAVSCSIGVAVLPDDAATAETLVRAAGAALSRAKEVRNIARRYAQEMAEGRYPIPALGALIHALDTRQLAVHYQPIAEIASGRITAVEALVRWTHPTLGQVPASEVVRLAEESGLMVAVSEFVIRTALKQMREWDAATRRSDLRLAVNISAVQVQEGGLVAMCDRLLAETGFDPRRVELELTESGAMRSSPAVLSTLQALRDRGFHLSIDDFGTGYSSLSRLERLPIDVVKIDRSFVQGITSEDGRSGALARAVIALGRSLGLRLVGEGVETPDQLAFLEAEGCDYVQGYLVARPKPAGELTDLLAAGTVALPVPAEGRSSRGPAPARAGRAVRAKGGRSAPRMAALD